MSRWRRIAMAWLVWAATTAVAVFVAWLGLSPVLAAGVPASRPAVPGAVAAVGATPSAAGPPSDSATRRTRPGSLAGWREIGADVWERSFHTDGGSATIRASAEAVALVSATPGEGYAVAVDDPDRLRVLVHFYLGDRVYTVDASWRDGAPYATVDAPG